MLLPVSRYILALALSFSSLLALAIAEPSPTNPHPATTTSSPADDSDIDSPRKIARLEDTHHKIKSTLDNLSQQSYYLQNNLSVLDQQLKHLELLQRQSPTSDNANQLKELHEEYQQIQNSLVVLRQQSEQLQTRVSTMTHQFRQLHQTLTQVQQNSPPSPTNSKITESESVVATSNVNTTPMEVRTASTRSENMQTVTTKTTASNEEIQQPIPAPAETKAIDTPVDPNLLPTPDQIVPITNAELEKSKASSSPKKVTPAKSSQEEMFFSSILHDPVNLLRLGGILVVLALLLLIFLFWPRPKKIVVPPNPNAFSAWNQVKRETALKNRPLLNEPEADLEPEYDFMNSKDAIPARLDLARGYLEMHKYAEAREAITPVFEQGNATQKQEASSLLQKIVQAEIG